MHIVQALLKFLLAAVLLGTGVIAAVWLFKIWSAQLFWAVKPPLFVLVLAFAFVSLDSGTGLVFPKNHNASLVHFDGAPDRKFYLIPGYNAYGEWIGRVLRKYLAPHGSIAAVEPGPGGYDAAQVAALIRRDIQTSKPDQVVVYAESMGSIPLAELLRSDPNLHINAVVLNAGVSRLSGVRMGGNALKIFNVLPGGWLSTGALKAVQWVSVGNSPANEPGTDAELAAQANKGSMQINAPRAVGQIRAITHFVPPKPGEFIGRVGTVRYMHAPGTYDDMVDTAQASKEWQEAFGESVFADVTMPWPTGLHTPTPSHPGSTAMIIEKAAGVA